MSWKCDGGRGACVRFFSLLLWQNTLPKMGKEGRVSFDSQLAGKLTVAEKPPQQKQESAGHTVSTVRKKAAGRLMFPPFHAIRDSNQGMVPPHLGWVSCLQPTDKRPRIRSVFRTLSVWKRAVLLDSAHGKALVVDVGDRISCWTTWPISQASTSLTNLDARKCCIKVSKSRWEMVMHTINPSTQRQRGQASAESCEQEDAFPGHRVQMGLSHFTDGVLPLLHHDNWGW